MPVCISAHAVLQQFSFCHNFLPVLGYSDHQAFRRVAIAFFQVLFSFGIGQQGKVLFFRLLLLLPPHLLSALRFQPLPVLLCRLLMSGPKVLGIFHVVPVNPQLHPFRRGHIVLPCPKGHAKGALSVRLTLQIVGQRLNGGSVLPCQLGQLLFGRPAQRVLDSLTVCHAQPGPLLLRPFIQRHDRHAFPCGHKRFQFAAVQPKRLARVLFAPYNVGGVFLFSLCPVVQYVLHARLLQHLHVFGVLRRHG